MPEALDLSAPDVVDARALVASIDWSSVPAPRPDSFAIETEDGVLLRTVAEFDAWQARLRSA